MWHYDWVWKNITIIFKNSVYWKKQVLICRGEAGTIMHKKENIGQVELATIAFGQSFQITPLQLATTAASLINGGERITPHFGVKVQNRDGKVIKNCIHMRKKRKFFRGRHRRKCAMPWKW